jgi:hypothetical protein
VRRISIITVIGALALACLPSVASAHAAAQPTVTIEPDCQDFLPPNSVDITLAGFPPDTPFHGKLDLPGGGSFEGDFRTDENGEAFFPHAAFSPDVGTWTVTITWSGGTLSDSVFVDCPTPPPFELSVKLLQRPQTSLRRVRVGATCSGAACVAQVHGALRVRRSNGVKRLPLGTETLRLQADMSKTLTIGIGKSARAAARRALAHDRRVTLRVRVRAHDRGQPRRVRFQARMSRVVR